MSEGARMEPQQIAVLEDLRTKPGAYLLVRGEYIQGGASVVGVDRSTGQKAFTLSVHLANAPLPDGDHIWVKDWSENDGLGDELESRGIIQFTGETRKTGYVTARMARIVQGSTNESR